MSRRPDRSQLECAFGGEARKRKRDREKTERRAEKDTIKHRIGEEAPTD